MRENTDRHHEDLEHPKRENHGDHRSRHPHDGEPGHREHRRGNGGREHHPHEESEALERREGSSSRGGHSRHASWHYANEDGHRHGGRRERVERGMLRYLLLDSLRHSPKHGYEIIKWLEEQTHGRYAPSAGTVYPTLQLLEDQGLLLAERADEKSVYRLTETGEAELQTHA